MNRTNQYKILALDLDGTLLDAQSRITPENARAVRMAQQAGVQIVLCTGRNVREVRRFSEQLEAAPDWLITANGAAVQHPDDRVCTMDMLFGISSKTCSGADGS